MSTLLEHSRQTYVASLETIFLRGVHLIPLWGAMSPWQRTESRRLTSEKAEAWMESQLHTAFAPWTFAIRVQTELWQAACASTMTLMVRNPLTLFSSDLPQILERASEQAAKKALQPYRKRSMSNSKRLKQRALFRKA